MRCFPESMALWCRSRRLLAGTPKDKLACQISRSVAVGPSCWPTAAASTMVTRIAVVQRLIWRLPHVLRGGYSTFPVPCLRVYSALLQKNLTRMPPNITNGLDTKKH